jgi:signal transduction histidine kinase
MSAALLSDQTRYKPHVDRRGVDDAEEEGGLQHASEEPTESGSLAAINRMARFVAHDFRHHLCAVYSNAEFLCNTKYAQSVREEMFEEIKTAIICMTDILDSVLLHSRTGSMFHLRLEPLNLIIEKAVQMSPPPPDADQVNFIYETMPLVEVCADSKWLCSAIFNLLLNACQAARLAAELKEVRVACEQDQHYVFIRITDSGPGVPTAIQKSLFQPFVSLQQQKGTGIGLTIVKSVAREHGGEVYFEESKSGRTSFILRLPKPDAAGKDAFGPRPIG